ncbi:MAG: oligosaccharide flippase family protein [Coprococcus sp.]|nr:oligosaccharide flippase family protein [Coprococcus sp.]
MTEDSNTNALKASLYYVICSFIIKGISFITTPFFSRILTQSEYGYVSNFNSWLSILTIVTTLSLVASLIRARFDFKDDYNSYVSTILTMGMIFSIICFATIFLNIELFKKIFSLDTKYILLLALCSIAQPAYDVFLQNQRFVYKYKLVTVMTVAVTLMSLALSFLLLYICDDNSWGMILGTQLPLIVSGIIIYIYYFCKSNSFKFLYCKYALVICVPYIFHLLSGVILSSSDRVMITAICGTKENAIYSMAYNIGLIINAIWMALNQAFSPWLGEKLNVKDYKPIKRVSTYYMILFLVIVLGMMLAGPEALMILGGHKYAASKNLIPVIMLSYVVVFVDSLFVNILQYEKHTLGMACATVTSALVNILLNYMCIPRFGYTAAAYTTFISYGILLIMDVCLVKQAKFTHVYNTKRIFAILCVCSAMFLAVLVLYKYYLIRYIILLAYIVIVSVLTYKCRHMIKKIIC